MLAGGHTAMKASYCRKALENMSKNRTVSSCQKIPPYLDVASWRCATPEEVVRFIKEKTSKNKAHPSSRRSGISVLAVRENLAPVDVYCYLKARFGEPNGFANRLRAQHSDNLVHWEFLLKAGDDDVLITGWIRQVRIMVPVHMTDQDWMGLILAIKGDYKRVGRKKSSILRSLEHWVIFPNRYIAIADLCADLHAKISDNKARLGNYKPSSRRFRGDSRRFETLARERMKLYQNCLQLAVLTPILAEAFINLLILAFCKPELRANRVELDLFIRERIHKRLRELNTKCLGFTRPVDEHLGTYGRFLKVMNKRNDTIHGNHDPEREYVERVYFEGTRPLFVQPGDAVGKYFEGLERQYRPDLVIEDYEAVHEFLSDLISSCLTPGYAADFNRVAGDHYPGFDIGRKKMGCLFAPRYNSDHMQGVRFDDELVVEWPQ
jgi:hypothetical protein